MQLEEFAARLRRSGDIVFFTGAGISTERAYPTFGARAEYGRNISRFIFKTS
jgi:NAD-dependent SIR2 family protein deacetylase